MQTTTLASPTALREFLLAVGTQAPSLHPHVDSPDTYRRWNGWNNTVAVGIDAKGQPFQAGTWHFASGGRVDLEAGRILGHNHLAVTEDDFTKRTGIVFPVEVLPARSVIRHPEHTPS